MNKLHLCCGHVYLDGWVNVDNDPDAVLAWARPDLRKLNSTTLSNYYKFPLGKHPNPTCVADIITDITNGGLKALTAIKFDEIIMISAFEHFTRDEAVRLVQDIYFMLNKGGKFHFNFPDLLASLDLIKTDPDNVENVDWQMRLIYGSHKNEYSVHKYGWTPKTIARVLSDAGFGRIVREERTSHDYPMIGITATR